MIKQKCLVAPSSGPLTNPKCCNLTPGERVSTIIYKQQMTNPTYSTFKNNFKIVSINCMEATNCFSSLELIDLVPCSELLSLEFP